MIASEHICKGISAWAMANIATFKPNGYGRQYLAMSSPLTTEIAGLKELVMQAYGIPAGTLQEPVFKDFCGINLEGASVHPHMDTNQGSLKHTRFNVLVSKPLSGGHPIHGTETLEVAEGGMWRCDAGSKTHASTAVIGDKPRIIMSFGFLLPVSWFY